MMLEQSSSWNVVSLEARANVAGLNLCFSAHFVHHFRIKSGSRTFLDIPGQCLGVTGRYANTLSVETLSDGLPNVVESKRSVRVDNDEHSQPES